MITEEPKVLLLDDDPKSAKEIKIILEEAGYHVLGVHSVTAGKTALREYERFDLIISETQHSGAREFQFLKFIKSNKRLHKIPVILCTSVKDARSVQKGIELGAADYIVKPVNRETILAKALRAIRSAPGVLLVVDDEELLLGLLKRILEREGHRVITALSAEQALALVEKSDVMAVISDIVMESKNGLELLDDIKSRYPSLPVLLMTGNSGDYSKEQVIAAGADGFITKPFNNLEITYRIGSVLESSRYISTEMLREQTATPAE